MLSYITKRTGLALFILLWSAFITFVVISIMPGDYFTKMKIAIAMQGLPVEETHRDLLIQHGLDRPWIVQFGSWVWRFVTRGDFGPSLMWESGSRIVLTVSWLFRPQGELINSLLICGTSTLIAWLAVIPIGVLASMRNGRWFYYGISAIGMPTLAMPGFVFAALVLWFLDVFVDPMMSNATLWGICGWRFEGLPMSWLKFGSCITHLFPIWVIVGAPVFILGFRVFRSSLMDIMDQPFLTVARSKGLGTRALYFKHAVRNALNPLISTLGLTLPTVLVNAFMVGFMFGIPTYGKLLRTAIQIQDPALLAAVMLFYSFVLVVGNLLADIGLAAVDPRIRYD